MLLPMNSTTLNSTMSETHTTWQKPVLWTIPTISGITWEALPIVETILLQRLNDIADTHQQAWLASSLAVEDMVISDMIARHRLPIRIFTLDTGRLNPETLDLLADAEQRYDLTVYRPEPQTTSVFDQDNGKDAMYRSLDLRKACCHLRKIEPLNRALENADAWLTGQRREQAVTRTELPFVENDKQRGIKKYNPITDWSEELVWAYIKEHKVPYNALYHRGYPSIGCQPCSKAIRQGEDVRAGRWWWESKDSKECGLHTK